MRDVGGGKYDGRTRAEDVILSHGDRALSLLGDTPEGAHWPNLTDRLTRFDVMLDLMAGSQEHFVLCDLGCGTGELLGHLRRRGLDNISYVGVDRSRLALEHARRKFPDATFIELDVNATGADLSVIECDFLVANGLFTAKWEASHDEMQAFLERTIARVWPVVRRGLAFNVMSKVVDWERDDLFHMDMDELAAFLHGLAGRRLAFRADYGLYEYTAYVYKDQATGAVVGSRIRDELDDVASTEMVQSARAYHVYPQQMLKDKLLASLPLQAAFRRYGNAMGLSETSELVAKKLTPLRDTAISHGVYFSEQVPAGESFEIAPPRVIGPGNQRILHGKTRSAYVACIKDARVRSRSSVIELDDRLALDFTESELSSLDDRMNLDPAIFAVEARTAYTIPSSGPCLELKEAFSLVGTHTWAFGHWMWEYLPRYVAATQGPQLNGVPVLVDAAMPPQHIQALEALLAPGACIVQLPLQERARVRRLWCAPTPMYMPLFEHMNDRFRWDLLAANPRHFANLIHEMNRRVPGETKRDSGRRVYLARRIHRHRKLLNHAQIEALASQHGFDIVYPEDLDFPGQVRMAREADWIIGPEGSAMFMAFFARPGTHVCILNHPYTIGLPVLTGLLEARGIVVTVVSGPAATTNEELPHFIDYTIDAEQFEQFLTAEVR